MVLQPIAMPETRLYLYGFLGHRVWELREVLVWLIGLTARRQVSRNDCLLYTSGFRDMSGRPNSSAFHHLKVAVTDLHISVGSVQKQLAKGY